MPASSCVLQLNSKKYGSKKSSYFIVNVCIRSSVSRCINFFVHICMLSSFGELPAKLHCTKTLLFSKVITYNIKCILIFFLTSRCNNGHHTCNGYRTRLKLVCNYSRRNNWRFSI